MKIIDELHNFIELAEKNRKYAPNTALGFKASLKRLETVLNEDESISLPLLEERFPQIMNAFYNKHKDDVSLSSMNVYQRRIKKVISDFKNWGSNFQNWGGWNIASTTPLKSRNEKKSSDRAIAGKPNDVEDSINASEKSDKDITVSDSSRYSSSVRFEIPLRQGVHAFVSTPSDITKNEARKIAKYVEYLIEISNDD